MYNHYWAAATAHCEIKSVWEFVSPNLEPQQGKRQRGRETKRQSDRETKRQKNRAENKNPEQSRVAQLVNNVIDKVSVRMQDLSLQDSNSM